MVDVGQKSVTIRIAVARGTLLISESLFAKLAESETIKQNIFTTAKTAGVLAIKNTGQLIPLCHPLNITTANIDMNLGEKNSIQIECEVKIQDKTGVEMEAMMGANIAALTVYDMCKSIDKRIIMRNFGLYKKTGGKSGDYHNPELDW